MNRRLCACIAATALATLAGCSSIKTDAGDRVYTPTPSKYIPQVDTTKLLPATIPYAGTLIPDTTIKLTPTMAIPLEKLVAWGTYIGIAYLIVDPQAPNWAVEEARLTEDYVHLSLQMKRYYNGGAGEARAVFHRRAKELMRIGNFERYEVVEYDEGMESAVIGSRRVAQGVIRLSGKQVG